MQDIILPEEKWKLAAEDCHDARGPACNASGEVFFVDPAQNKICRIDLDGHVKEFLSDAGRPTVFPSAREASSTRFRSRRERS